MAFYTWSDNLSVNIVEIDNQHKHLVELINELFDAMSMGKGKDILGHILSNLIDYTKEHFKTEEKYMKEFTYPLTSTHTLEHDILTRQVVALNNEFRDGKANISVQVLNFLRDWLNTHIMQNDKKFGEFLNNVGKR